MTSTGKIAADAAKILKSNTASKAEKAVAASALTQKVTKSAVAMRVHFCSDLHLEFGAFNGPLPPDGEVLILAGDITLAGVFDKESDLHYRGAALRERTDTFINRALDAFPRVFWLTGNHEHYNYDIEKSVRTLSAAFPKVVFLDDTSVELTPDVMLFGGTLWTDMNGDNARDHRTVGYAMNDFRLIECNGGRFTTVDAVEKHRRTLDALDTALAAHPDKTFVVATHHAPDRRGINKAHILSSINAGYASDLSTFIKGRPRIKHWIFGHTHIQTKFNAGGCLFQSNARGYIGRETSADTFAIDKYVNASKRVKA